MQKENYERYYFAGLITTVVILASLSIAWIKEPVRMKHYLEELSKESVLRGREIYIEQCALCHGSSGQGEVGPALNSKNYLESASDRIVFETISAGRPGTIMPAWAQGNGGALTDEGIRDLVNFIRLFMKAKIFRWTLNSTIVAGSVTASNLFLGTLAGYALAKKKFHGRTFIFWLIVSMMMVPYQITIVPLYIIISRLNWTSTYWALIVPSLSFPFSIFLMKQYLQTLPSELIDAARIDGCSEFGIFLRIIIPLAKPGMAVLSIFIFMGTWNDFLWPLIVTNKEVMFTLQVGLSSIQTVFYTDYGLLMAGAAYSTIPMFIVFFAAQKYFVKGITVGAIKG